MNKKQRASLAESLSSALEPPRKPRASHLDSILEVYDDDQRGAPDSPTPRNSPLPHTRPSLSNGPAVNESPLPDEGPIPDNGPLKSGTQALQINGPSTGEGPLPGAEPKGDFSLLDSLPQVEGFMRWFHQLTDFLLPQLTPPEQAAYIQLYRLSWGWDKATCLIGFPKLAQRTNLSESGARLATKGLIKKGLVKKRGVVFGKNMEQGIEWEVFEPPALSKFRASRNKGLSRSDGPILGDGPSPAGAIKNNVSVSKETHTQTKERVGVGSEFSIEQCRKFADHLKQTGQGITNPGGYATKIFRSGEADPLMREFFKPKPDVSACPDCKYSQGFVFVDPHEPDKGVRKCTHPKLQQRQ